MYHYSGASSLVKICISRIWSDVRSSYVTCTCSCLVFLLVVPCTNLVSIHDFVLGTLGRPDAHGSYAVTAIACVAIVHAIWEGVYNTRPTKVTSLLAVVHCWMPVLVACIMLYLLRNVFFDGTKTDVVAISAMTLLPLCGLSLVLITEEPFLE